MTTSPTTQYTITQAHRITGRSRTTLQRHLKKGVLSSTTDEFKNVRIDASELMRVYGADQCDFARARGEEGVCSTGSKRSSNKSRRSTPNAAASGNNSKPKSKCCRKR